MHSNLTNVIHIKLVLAYILSKKKRKERKIGKNAYQVSILTIEKPNRKYLSKNIENYLSENILLSIFEYLLIKI